MAQIVKSVKKRTFRDPVTDSSLSESAAIDEAASVEGEVTQFLHDLPPAFKLDIDTDLSTLSAASSSPLFSTSSPGHSSSVSLVVQQCELVITGQRLILKIYLPFLRPNNSGSMPNANHNQAALGTVNAAHAIIHASRVLYVLCKQPPGAKSKRPGPAIFDYYSFGQALFDAAVVCAHSVITQPTAIWAKIALDDVVGALEVMKDPVVATGRGSTQAGFEDSVSEPVRVIEMLKKKAEDARTGNATSFESSSGSKRKHAEVETNRNHLLAGFQLPYVGAAVASAGPAAESPNSASASSPLDSTHSDSSIPLPCNGSEGARAKRPDGEKTKSKKDKKAPYPMVGIRVRPGREGPLLTRRERAHSTASTSSFVETDTRMQPPGPFASGQSSSQVSTPAPANHHSFSIPAAQEHSSIYQPPPSSESMQPPMQPELMPELIPNSHTEYSAPFTNSEISSLNLPLRRKFTIHESGPQQGYPAGTSNPMSMYDHNQGGPFTNPSCPGSFRPSSTSQPPNGSLSFGGGPGISSPLSSTPFTPSHDSSTQSYEPPMANSPSDYFAAPSYQPNFDYGSQGPPHGLPNMSVGNTSNMNGSVTTSSDMIGHGLQQPFGNPGGQGQGWQQDNGGNGQLLQSHYKPYFPT